MNARATWLCWAALACALLWPAPLVAAQPSDDDDSQDTTPAATTDEGDAAPAGDAPGGAPDVSKAAPPAEAAPPPPPPSRMRVAPFAGFGFGTRAMVRPTSMSTGQRLPTMAFPAAEVGLGATLWPANRFSLGLLLRYQTSVGMRVEERASFALPYTISARAERGELSVAPIVRLDDGPLAPSLAFPLGFGVRTFWPDIHEQPLIGYSLIGPQLRVELLWPLVERVRLRLGPELQWIIGVDQALRDEGVAQMGASIGGELSVQVRVSTVFSLDLCYRESHAFASSINAGPIFNDVERFMTLRLLGEL